MAKDSSTYRVLSSKALGEMQASLMDAARERTVPFRILPKTITDGDDTNLAGYLKLHELEEEFTRIAFHVFREGFDVWNEILSTFKDLLFNTYTIEEGSLESTLAKRMSLQFASVAVGTSKMIFDGCANGYYTQCLALTRQLLETWKVIAYLELDPSASESLNQRIGGEEPRRFDRTKMNNELAQSTKFGEVYAAVGQHMEVLHKHTHPTWAAFAQTASASDGFIVIGANFIPPLAITVIDQATFASLIILQQLVGTLRQNDEEWQRRVGGVLQMRETWMSTRPFPPSDWY